MGINKPVVIFYREGHETLEQVKTRYKQEHGAELPGHTKIVCYRRIDTTEVRMQ